MERIFYTCDQCGYTFPLSSEEDACPDCASRQIHVATPKEIFVRISAKIEEDRYLAAHPDRA